MRKKIIFMLLCGASLASFEFSWDLIRAKLAQPMPAWMERQIEEDLELFPGKEISNEAIEATIRDVRKIPSSSQVGFIRYRIQNNRISVSSPTEMLSDVRVAHVVEVLEDLAKHLPLPDIEFLSALWDAYDNPIYLVYTHCPVFTICKSKSNRFGVLFPEFRHFSYRQRLINDIRSTSQHSPWAQKMAKAHWRGMTSGWHYNLDNWDTRPRSRLVLFSKAHPDLLDAAFTSPYSLNYAVKQTMEHYGLFQPWTYPAAFVSYKYLISIDGNTFASNFWWQLLSNCAVLKNESPYVEWFYVGLTPNVHYLPYSLDLSDLKDKLLWLRTHDDEARQIAEAGRAFAEEYLTNEALVVYFYRLLRAYAAKCKAVLHEKSCN
ncbi:MAG: hypothetical protein KGJ02_08655 [Verrucomicrobiota bacterium]|nr:hypothetical protein [Verrucomicrobiota bacterium]